MKILLVQTGFLGDVVLSTPVITAVRKLYPTAAIAVMTIPQAADLVRHHPANVSVITFDKRSTARGALGLLRTAQQLRREKFSLVLSLHKSWRTALLLRLAGIPLRYGFSEASGQLLYSKTAARADLGHEVERNLAILRALGHDPLAFRTPLSVGLAPQHAAAADTLLAAVKGFPLVGLAPGSVWFTKQWTPEGFAAVGDALSARGFKIVLLGGPADSAAAEKVAALMQAPTINVVGKTPLLVSAAIINRLSLLVTNDSAPLHLGSAMRIPVVAAFCATVPEFGFGPWMTEHRVVGVAGLDCRPCGRHGGMRCPTGTHACQKNLTAAMVVGACSELLAGESSVI